MPSQTKRLSSPRLFQALYVAISDGTCRRRFAVHVTENAAGCSPWDRLGQAVVTAESNVLTYGCSRF